jgi:cell division protein FtsQ
MTDPAAIEPPLERPPRKWKWIALILLLLLLAPASWLARRAASRMEFFQLRSIAVEGTRFLSPESVIERLAVDTSRSVWDDTEPLAERLRSMPQVAEVTINRKLPGRLVVNIRENLPVALAPSPRGLEAVDSAGVVLPIDPARIDLDLPVANQRDKSILSLLTDTRARNPMLYRRISEITKDGKDSFILTLAPFVTNAATLKVRASVGVSVSRLADIFPVESDLMRRRANVAELDLRYRDQVIARLQ